MKRIVLLLVVFLLSTSIAFAQLPCTADFNCDQNVDATDVDTFLGQFGRNPFNDPCPDCYDSPCPCSICPYGMIDCGTKCVDPMTDEDFCGVDQECIGGTVCGIGEICVSGVCNASGPTCEGTLSAAARWCDQGDGTVKDMTTGLVWLKKADWGGQYPLWAGNVASPDAHHRTTQLWDGSPYEGSAGLSDGSVEGDWRLPTKTEFVGITTGTEYILYSQMYFFTGVQAHGYWSSNAGAQHPNYAWYGYMYDGSVNYNVKSSTFYVWPVRGGH